jgi:hypothetical protein
MAQMDPSILASLKDGTLDKEPGYWKNQDKMGRR